MTCPGCGRGINIDPDIRANAAEEIRSDIVNSPPESVSAKLSTRHVRAAGVNSLAILALLYWAE